MVIVNGVMKLIRSEAVVKTVIDVDVGKYITLPGLTVYNFPY
jgi:hypothetical protein